MPRTPPRASFLALRTPGAHARQDHGHLYPWTPFQHPLLPHRPGWWRRARPGRKRRSSRPAPAGWLATRGCACQSRPAAKLRVGANSKLLFAGCRKRGQRLRANLNTRTWLPMKTTTVCCSPSTEPLLTRSVSGPDAASAALPNAFRTKLLATSSTSGTTWRICRRNFVNGMLKPVMTGLVSYSFLAMEAGAPPMADCPAPGRRRAGPCPRPTPHGCSTVVGVKIRLHCCCQLAPLEARA